MASAMTWSSFLLVVLACAAHSVATGSTPSSWCSRSGLVPHPRDCSQFIGCLGTRETGFESEPFLCPRGEAFSPTLSACVPRDLVPSCNAPLTDATRINEPICKNQTVSCEDCTHLIYCLYYNGEYINPVEIPCDKYCDPDLNACVADLPQGCAVSGFTCTGMGYFPDPNNCTMYHICYDVLNNLFESHRCPTAAATAPTKYVYSSTQFICIPQVTTADCVVANCPLDYVGLIPFPKDPKYYVLCLPELEKRIFRCAGNLEYVESAHVCKFVCRAAGNFPNTEDCTMYHTCTAVTGGFSHTEEACPPGFAFDTDLKRCAPLSEVPLCTTPAPATTVYATTAQATTP